MNDRTVDEVEVGALLADVVRRRRHANQVDLESKQRAVTSKSDFVQQQVVAPPPRRTGCRQPVCYLVEREPVGTEPGVLASVLAVVEDLAVERVVRVVPVLLPSARELGVGEELLQPVRLRRLLLLLSQLLGRQRLLGPLLVRVAVVVLLSLLDSLLVRPDSWLRYITPTQSI